jgi:predicted nucleic acid-binding protein
MTDLLLDTNVIIDFDRVRPKLRDDRPFVSTITLAELAVGPLGAKTPSERATRQQRLQWAERTFRWPLAFDQRAAQAYGPVVAALHDRGRSIRRRSYGLLIAAIALSRELPVATANPDDFEGLGVEVVDVR